MTTYSRFMLAFLGTVNIGTLALTKVVAPDVTKSVKKIRIERKSL